MFTLCCAVAHIGLQEFDVFSGGALSAIVYIHPGGRWKLPHQLVLPGYPGSATLVGKRNLPGPRYAHSLTGYFDIRSFQDVVVGNDSVAISILEQIVE